jgi:3-phytase
VVTDRDRDQLRIYRIGSGGALTDVTADDVPALSAKTEDGPGDRVATFGRYAVVSHRDTPRLGLFRLEERTGKVTYRMTDALHLPRQPDPRIEALAVDGSTLIATQAGAARWEIRLEGDRFVGVPRRALSLSPRGA